MMNKIWKFLAKYYALLIVCGVFAASCAAIALRPEKHFPEGTVVIRIGHWQLESGVKEGLDVLAREYERLHPNVRIIQEAIPESTYPTWLSTQFMGGTQPDLVQMGGLPYNLLLAYYNRYCVPLTPYVNEPNPYNKGTPLEGKKWRETIRDGMRTGYVDELQEYMGVPLSQTAIRVFYNKTLLKKLSALDHAPKDYREFYNACVKIKGQKNPKTNLEYIPVVGSAYHFGLWGFALWDSLTYPLVFKADFNYDGYVGTDELFVAVNSGLVSFRSPPVEARFRMNREIADFCQSGFTGLMRDDGVFLFVQQRAVFISTGTWDANGLLEQAKGEFEVGVMDFPFPAKDDPEYGRDGLNVIYGPRYEKPGTAFFFTLTNNCANREIAVDFLRFLTGMKQNEKLNKIICWIPSVEGAETNELFKNFKPNLRGVYGMFNPNLGGNTWLRWDQLTSLFNVGQISYEKLADDFQSWYVEKGLEDYEEAVRDWRRGLRGSERQVLLQRLQWMESGTDENELKYNLMWSGRLLFAETGKQAQMKFMRNNASMKYAPYEYRPEVLERIRKNAKNGVK